MRLYKSGLMSSVLLSVAQTPRAGPGPSFPAVWLGPAAVACFMLFNAAYVGWWCPHDLAPDEAHYWDWSRRPDWGYYSKGPLVAWLIRVGCLLFGDTPFGVRGVAVACGGLVLLGLWRLTKLATASDRAALGVVLAAMTHPAATAVGVLSTIDGPFLACWVWAVVAALRRKWGAAGLLVALGTLAKPTMLLFPACVLLLLLIRPEWRSRRVLFFFPLSLVGLIPLVLWNAAHDWVSVRHLFGHAGNGGEAAPWYSPLAYVGGQVALLLGGWFVLWALAVWRFRPWRTDANTALLWCLSVPVFGVFLLASVRTTGELNWPVAAYLSGAVLVARWFTSRDGQGAGHDSPAPWPSPRVDGGGLTGLVLLGRSRSVGARWPGIVRPALAAVSSSPSDAQPTPARRIDPTCRLSGWRTLAEAVDEARKAAGDEAVVATMAWNVPGELGFYCSGHPTVYTFAPAVGDRFSQYDLWRPNPVADAQAFRGRTFVYVGDRLPDGVFERLEFVRRVTHTGGGVPVASWQVWVGRGYRGFDHAERMSPRY